MLKNNLYTIESFTNAEGKVNAAIQLHATHKIFEGHFPGQPVLPGVCMMQIIKEILEKAVEKELFMQSADQCKFLSMVDPNVSGRLDVEINYSKTADENIAVNAILKSENQVFLKMKSEYRLN